MAGRTKSLTIDQEERLLVRIAWACEIEGNTQAEVANRFGITRLRVNKALGQARRRGIVRISINSDYAPCAELEGELTARFGLALAEIVPSPTNAADTQMMVGMALGNYLSGVLANPDIKLFGMSWGNTLNLATRFMAPVTRPDLEIVSVMGGLTKGTDLNSYEITRRLADICNADLSYFTVPIYASSAESRDVLIAQDVFLEIIKKIRSADAIAMAAGDISDASLLMRDGLPTEYSPEELIAKGAVGDILGYMLDETGEPVDHPINSRLIGISLEDLGAIPNVILAAGGSHKVAIMKAVLARGVVDTLVTDETTAIALLS